MTDNDAITAAELPDVLKPLCFRGLDGRYYVYEYLSANEPLHKIDVTCHVETILRALVEQARAP